MANYRFFIRYDGTRYDGWQRQGNTDRTIQGKLEKILLRLFGRAVEVHASGRTDGGVHALGQVANFHSPEGMDPFKPQEIENYINTYLPEDICVFGLEFAPPRFHSRLNALGKTYCYRIYTGKTPPIFVRRYVWWLPEQLDDEAMRRAAALLSGTHDYASFCANPRMKKSTVRRVDRLSVERRDDLLTVQAHGDGFLHNMVRILTGTLVQVGRGQRAAAQMPEILLARDRALAGPAAPPQGLCLESVDYDPPFSVPKGADERSIWRNL